MEIVERLEKQLFGVPLEELLQKIIGQPIKLFEDKLEKQVFYFLLDLALANHVGATSVLVAEHTQKTKNTVNVRLERLFYKRLVQKQQIGNALLYFIPIHQILLDQLLRNYVEKTSTDSKEILRTYIRNVESFFAPTLAYYRETHQTEPKKSLKDMVDI
ncbi:MAG: hypothetical protein ACFFBD_03250 [Candidatus Hodarchaeota archaeon]